MKWRPRRAQGPNAVPPLSPGFFCVSVVSVCEGGRRVDAERDAVGNGQRLSAGTRLGAPPDIISQCQSSRSLLRCWGVRLMLCMRDSWAPGSSSPLVRRVAAANGHNNGRGG